MDRSLFTTLLACTFALLLMYLLFTILSPFLTTLVWAGAIGVLTRPLYERLLSFCNGREIVASALLTMAVVMAVILPLVGLIFALSRDIAQAYQYLESASASGSSVIGGGFLSHPTVAMLLEKARIMFRSLDLGPDLDAMVLPAIKKGAADLLNYSTGVAKNFLGFLVKLVLMVITLFFYYKDWPSFLRRFLKVVTLRDELKTRIVETVTRVLGAVMYGIVLTCLVQGTLGGLGFWVAGLPSPLLFGALMAVSALIPIVGTALVWLPGAIYLLMQDQTLSGVLLIAWCVIVVSSIDNIIRPLFISGRAGLHLMVIMFGVLGGILAFGITGVIAGPVILALVLVFFEESRPENAP